MGIFESVAHAATGGTGGGGGIVTLLFIGGMIAVFYFLFIRPQSKQRKQHQALISGLSRGDEVVMAGGIMGIITKVDDDSLSVKVAKGTEVRFQKQAVHTQLPKGTVQHLDG